MVCVVGFAAAQPPRRYLAVFANGQRVEGEKLTGWHVHPGPVRLDNTALLDANRPLRWLRDRSLRAYDAGSDAWGHIEFVGGDRLVGRVVGLASPTARHRTGQRVRLRVACPESPDVPLHLRREGLHVFAGDIRRVVVGRQPDRLFQPGTAFLSGSRQVRFLGARWCAGGVRLLLDGGVQFVPLADVAELHLPAANAWRAYYRQLAVLCPDASSPLIQLATTDGLIVTGSAACLHAMAVGKPDESHRWYHFIQPTWSDEAICVPFKRIRTRWHFAPHEVPLTRLDPVRSVQRSIVGWRWRWRRNGNVAGGALVVGGPQAGWGIGVHAHNELTFELPSSARSFRARVGIDRTAGNGGCARALVHLNTTGSRPLYRSKPLVGSASSVDTGTLNLGVGRDDSRRLILVADAAHADRPAGADPLDIRDSLDWVDPLVVLDRGQLQAEVRRHVDAAIPAWRGWSAAAAGAAAPPARMEWTTTDPKNPRFVPLVATGGRELVLTAPGGILPQHRWLKLDVVQIAPPAPVGRLGVRVSGRSVAHMPVHRPGVDRPYLVPLTAYHGKKVKLEVVYTPGSKDERVDWRTLSLAGRKTRVNWTALRTVEAVSQNGEKLTSLPDGSILAGGGIHRVARGVDTYVVRGLADLPRITAIRLEALADSALPGGGPGRFGGNFVLSQFRVSTLPIRRDVLHARYVRIELPHAAQVLNLAEVQVFRPPPDEPALLARLRQRPDRKTAGIVAILKTPRAGRTVAQRCRLRAYLDAIAENIARKGHATQSSTSGELKPALAIDGEVGGGFTHTNQEDRPWWQVDLGRSQAIDRIVVWNRIDYGLVARLTRFNVVLLDEKRKVVWRRDGIADPPVPAVEVTESDARGLVVESAAESFAQAGYPAAQSLDATPVGWAVSSRLGESHAAVFVLEEPVDARKTGLEIELKHAYERALQTLGRFRLLATGDDPPIEAEPVGIVIDPYPLASAPPPGPAPKPLASPYCLFEDDGRFLAASEAQQSKVTLLGDDRHSGRRAVRIEPPGPYRMRLPYVVPIREKPGEGEFRFVRFAFRKRGGGQVHLTLEHVRSKERLCRYEAGTGTPTGEAARSVWQLDLPEEWIVMDRDVFQDFGKLDLTGLAVTCAGGTDAVLDHIYVARTSEDFQRLPPAPSPELTNQKARRVLAGPVLNVGFPTMVSVTVEGRTATGVLVGQEGYVLTAGHVLARPGKPAAVRLPDGRTVRGTTAGINRGLDVGLVRITDKGPWKGLKLGNTRMPPSHHLYVGFTFAPHFEAGKAPVSFLADPTRTGEITYWTDYGVKDGIPGGPLLDKAGQIVGVHTTFNPMGHHQYSMTHTILADWPRLQRGEVWGTWLPGAGPIIGIWSTGTAKGCRIDHVYPASSAAAAGLRAGDIVATVNGHPIADLFGIGRIFATKDPGDVVTLVINRGGKTSTHKLKLMPRRKQPPPKP